MKFILTKKQKKIDYEKRDTRKSRRIKYIDIQI